MAQDGRIYITITDEPVGSGKGSGGSPKRKKEEFNGKFDDSDAKYIDNQLQHFVRNQTTQAISFALGNIGNYTGDFNTQRNVSTLYNDINILMNIGNAIAVGAKTAGGIGAAVGAAVSIGSIGINFAMQEWTGQRTTKQQNYNINQLRNISGLNGLTNGSR